MKGVHFNSNSHNYVQPGAHWMRPAVHPSSTQPLRRSVKASHKFCSSAGKHVADSAQSSLGFDTGGLTSYFSVLVTMRAPGCVTSCVPIQVSRRCLTGCGARRIQCEPGSGTKAQLRSEESLVIESSLLLLLLRCSASKKRHRGRKLAASGSGSRI